MGNFLEKVTTKRRQRLADPQPTVSDGTPLYDMPASNHWITINLTRKIRYHPRNNYKLQVSSNPHTNAMPRDSYPRVHRHNSRGHRLQLHSSSLMLSLLRYYQLSPGIPGPVQWTCTSRDVHDALANVIARPAQECNPLVVL
jgi:hypothetical protein